MLSSRLAFMMRLRPPALDVRFHALAHTGPPVCAWLTTPSSGLGLPESQARFSEMRCEVLAIGTELLLGQIVDSNSAWFGEHLAASCIDSYEQPVIAYNRYS